MFLDNLLSIVTFIPLIGAAILALFLRGDDEAAQRNAIPTCRGPAPRMASNEGVATGIN